MHCCIYILWMDLSLSVPIRQTNVIPICRWGKLRHSEVKELTWRKWLCQGFELWMGRFILFGPVILKNKMFPALNQMLTWWIWPSVRSRVAQPAVQSLTWLDKCPDKCPDQGWRSQGLGKCQARLTPWGGRTELVIHSPSEPEICFSACQTYLLLRASESGPRIQLVSSLTWDEDVVWAGCMDFSEMVRAQLCFSVHTLIF